MLDLARRFTNMTSASPSLRLSSNTSCSVQQVSHLGVNTLAKYQAEEEEDWEDDFAFEQELAIPTSIENVQASFNRDRKCILQLAKKIQELKSIVQTVENSVSHTTVNDASSPLARDIQLSKFVIDLSEDPSHLSESLQMDTLLCNQLHQFLFYCDLDTWNTIGDSSTFDLERTIHTHSKTENFSLVPDVQWIDLLALKTEILQSRLESYLS
ncbi:hypothetical protein K7432_004022 [Basidiobolus ranarum]|uniref:Uncharacterized protein n=1 Tax=Basidiobolus ranarum TaxID=34480 RepID=A0ABR2WZ08_9FUNG